MKGNTVVRDRARRQELYLLSPATPTVERTRWHKVQRFVTGRRRSFIKAEKDFSHKDDKDTKSPRRDIDSLCPLFLCVL